MTLKQQLFCLEYVTDFNETRSMAAAGFKPSSTSPLDSKECTNLITELLQERAKRLMITGDTVILELMENVQAARKCRDFNASNAALRQIAELTGQVIPKGGKQSVQQTVVIVGQAARSAADDDAYKHVGVVSGGERLRSFTAGMEGLPDMLPASEGVLGRDYLPGSVQDDLQASPE